MISPHVPGVGYTWIIVAHQKAAKIFSSLVTVGGLVTLYVLLCLFNSCLQQQQQQDDDPYIQQRNAITEYLQNHNQTVSVEQLAYCAFLLVAIPNHSNNSSNNQLDETSLRGAEQINAIFNLIVSFGLGMLLLMFISAMTLMCYPRSRHDYGMERWEERRASKRYRLLKIGLLLRKFHVRLKVEDACEKDPSQSKQGQGEVEGEGMSSESSSWMIPLPGTPNEDSNVPVVQNRRIVSNGCAICLDPYVVGDKVAYSSNTTCVHAFHQACIQKWLISLASSHPPCPCCRHPFFSMKDHPNKA